MPNPDQPGPEMTYVDEWPEHEKLSAVKDRSQAIGEFLEWLETEPEGFVLCEHKCPHGYWPMTDCEESKYCRSGDESAQYWATNILTANLLARFFGIDRAKLDAEKDAMLAQVRAANGRIG